MGRSIFLFTLMEELSDQNSVSNQGNYQGLLRLFVISDHLNINVQFSK